MLDFIDVQPRNMLRTPGGRLVRPVTPSTAAMLTATQAEMMPTAIPDTYDDLIRAAATLYLPAYDWRLYKAQLWQESHFNPEAISPSGAQGIAQFMPDTWIEAYQALDFGPVSPFSVPESIEAGAWYMNRMLAGWTSPRPAMDRYKLALASYNAGFGNLIKAQKRVGGKLLYAEIIQGLPQITGHHSGETIEYVRKICDVYWPRLKA